MLGITICIDIVGNNPVNAVDPDGTIARQQGDHYGYVVEGAGDYLEFLVGARVRNGVNGPIPAMCGDNSSSWRWL